LGGCLILGLSLASMQASQKSYKLLPLLVVPLSSMLAALLSSALDVALYGGIVLAAALAVSFFAKRRNCGAILILGLMCFLMIPLHRSAVLFFTVSVISAAGLSNFASRYWLNPWVVRIILVMVFVLAGEVLLRWFGVLGIPDIGIALAEVAKDSLGIDFMTDPNRSVGVGSKIALFEVSRAVGVLLCFLGFISLLKAQPNRRLLTYQFVAASLLLLVVLGFPFGYRAAFFLPIFLACIVVYQFGESSPKGQRLTNLTVEIYILGSLAASAAVYASGGVASSSQGRILPVLIGVALVATLPLLIMRARRMAAMTMFAVILIAATLVDRQFIRAHFMHYAYPGYTSRVSGPVSHYDLNDIKMAAALKKIPGEIVVISDPLTMANMRGLGGHNSLLLFTNLDTGTMGAKLELHRYLKILSDSTPDQGGEGCPTLEETIRVLASGQSPDLTYALMWLNFPGTPSKKVLLSTGYSNSLRLSLTGRSEGIVGTLNGKSTADWNFLLGLHSEDTKKTRSEDTKKTRSEDTKKTRSEDTKKTRSEDTKIRFAVVMNDRTAEWIASALPVSQTYFPAGTAFNAAVFRRLERECGAVATADSAVLIFDFNGNTFDSL
jgi:hypothetical protein